MESLTIPLEKALDITENRSVYILNIDMHFLKKLFRMIYFTGMSIVDIRHVYVDKVGNVVCNRTTTVYQALVHEICSTETFVGFEVRYKDKCSEESIVYDTFLNTVVFNGKYVVKENIDQNKLLSMETSESVDYLVISYKN